MDFNTNLKLMNKLQMMMWFSKRMVFKLLQTRFLLTS